MDFLKPVFKTYKRGENTPKLAQNLSLRKWQFGFEFLLRDVLKSLRARRAEIGKEIEVSAQQENVAVQSSVNNTHINTSGQEV